MYKPIRYIGSKQKILDFLEDSFLKKLKPGDSFFDGFSGTGIVSQYVAEKKSNIKIYAGDISLYSDILFQIINFRKAGLSEKFVIDYISDFQSLKLIEDGDIFNEFSKNGVPKTYFENRLFFSEKAGKTIDTFKEKIIFDINSQVITESQAKVLMFYILVYACKSANTTSIFGAFLKSEPITKKFDINFVNQINKNIQDFINNDKEGVFLTGDIISNIEKISPVKIIYLDPPYSTRKYESNYHILNYISDFDFAINKIKNGTKTGLPLSSPPNAFGKKAETINIFAKMIKNSVLKCEMLVISYNTDGEIKQSWLEDFCKNENLSLETKKLEYKRFKSNNKNNDKILEEIIWIIKKVKK